MSAAPGGRAEAAVAVPEGGSAANPCAAEEQRLLDEFAREIGTGRQLIEDAVTTAVTRHTAADLSTPGGKDALKAEIKKTYPSSISGFKQRLVELGIIRSAEMFSGQSPEAS